MLRLAARRRLVPPSGGRISQLKRGPFSVLSSCAFRGKLREASAPPRRSRAAAGSGETAAGSGECTVFSSGKRRVPTARLARLGAK